MHCAVGGFLEKNLRLHADRVFGGAGGVRNEPPQANHHRQSGDEAKYLPDHRSALLQGVSWRNFRHTPLMGAVYYLQLSVLYAINHAH